MIYNHLRIKALFVRAKGIEPIRLSAPDPKSGLSTNFNTPANRIANVRQFIGFANFILQKDVSAIHYILLSGKIVTGVPTDTYLINLEISSFVHRTQPSVAIVPIDSGKHVPWIPILSNPGTFNLMK